MKKHMKTLIEKIWSYGILTDQEKVEVESFVAANPEYRPVLKDSKAVHALLGEAGTLLDDPVENIAMAYLVAHSQITSGIAPGILDRAFKELEHKIEAMPHALERYEKVRDRMEEIALNSSPLAQFEQLSGYSLERDFSKVEDNNGAFTGNRRVKDRPAIASQKSSKGRFRSGVRAALLFAVPLFVMVWGFHENRLARNAYTSADILLVNEIVEERGLDEFLKPVSPDVVFTFAQRALYESQKVWLGVYYTYDEEKLAYAEELLLRVRQNEVSSPFLKEESTYLLAKANLAKEDFPTARLLLDELINMRGRRLREASELRSLL